MKTGPAGLDLIRSFESFSPVVYICPAGWPTIGYGHVVRPGEEEKFAGGITEAEAEEVLAQDVRATERSINRLIRVFLTQKQFDALASFTFNLGGGALQHSTLRIKINREEHESAIKEFGRWIIAGGRKLRGLIRRRAASAAMYEAGC